MTTTAVVAGTAGWALPEILVATPAAAATLSSPEGGGGSSGSTGSTGSTDGTGGTTAAGSGTTSNGSTDGTSDGSTSAPSTGSETGSSGGTLAFTGFDALRDAEIGAAIMAGGWALTRWSSKAEGPAMAADHGSFDDGSFDDTGN